MQRLTLLNEAQHTGVYMIGFSMMPFLAFLAYLSEQCTTTSGPFLRKLVNNYYFFFEFEVLQRGRSWNLLPLCGGLPHHWLFLFQGPCSSAINNSGCCDSRQVVLLPLPPFCDAQLMSHLTQVRQGLLNTETFSRALFRVLFVLADWPPAG